MTPKAAVVSPPRVLTDTLALLRAPPWDGLVDDLLRDACLIWLGSAISRDRYPNVNTLLELLLDQLYQRAQDPTSGGAYHQALKQVVALTPFAAKVDLTQPPSTWPQRDDVVSALWSKYSDALDIPIPGAGSHAIMFDVLNLPRLYNSPQEPDAEHRFVALLIEEGILDEVITTNWDPLVEDAFAALNSGRRLSVVARPDDLTASRPRLLKIHGCARLSEYDGAAYRDFLIATHTQIIQWLAQNKANPFGDLMRAMIRERRSLFIGISMQDENLQVEYFSAIRPEPRPVTPPWVVFGKPQVERPQQQLLHLVYGTEEYTKYQAAIDVTAALPLYAKPLLGGLFVSCLWMKALMLLEHGRSEDIPPLLYSFAESGLLYLVDTLCAHMSGHTPEAAAWRWLATIGAAAVSRLIAIYRDQEPPDTPFSYAALHPTPLSRLALDRNMTDLGDHRLILIIGALYEGAKQGRWTVHLCNRVGDIGQFRVDAATGQAHIFLLRGGATRLSALLNSGLYDPTSAPDITVIYTSGSEPTSRSPHLHRSPRRRLPGAGTGSKAHEVSVEALLPSTPTGVDFLDALSAAVGL